MPNLHPLICSCGSLNFNRVLVMFPLHWVATCRCCGTPRLEAHIQVGKKRRWIEGHFDERSIWYPGKFVDE